VRDVCVLSSELTGRIRHFGLKTLASGYFGTSAKMSLGHHHWYWNIWYQNVSTLWT